MMQVFERRANSGLWRRAMESTPVALLLVGFACPMWAIPQQISLAGGVVGTFAIPTGSPYSTLTSWRIEGRETIGTIPTTGYANIASSNGFQVRAGFGVLLVNEYQDASPYIQYSVPLTAGEDFVWRLQKNASTGILSIEKWKVDGTNYQVNTIALNRITAGFPGTWSIGDGGQNLGTLAFLRWYSTIVPLGSKAPFGGSGGDLGDWEFNGNGSDSSSHHNGFSGLGGATYTLAAIYPPACILPPQTTFRAGTTVTAITAANSFPLNGTNALSSYVWQVISGASVLNWSSQSVANPTLQGFIFGSYTIQLTVTDSGNQSSTCSTKYGAVATDANNSVIVANPVHAQILGPLIADYANPWQVFVSQHTQFAQSMIQRLAGTSPTQPQFVNYWDIAQAGTVTVTSGSTAVVGVGTTFTTTFCQGPGTPTVPKSINSGPPSIVVWNPIGGSLYAAGITGRQQIPIASCTDDTHLTLATGYQTTSYVLAGTGLSYAYVDGGSTGAFGNTGAWGFGGAPANYYDNVMALYAKYYISGIDDYLTAARQMADRWFSYPQVDKGIIYDGNWSNALARRAMSLSGLYLRNADNPPFDYTPGLTVMANSLIGATLSPSSCTRTGPSTGCPVDDLRENGAALLYTSYCALYNSNPTQASACATAVSLDMTNRWTYARQAAGNWVSTDVVGNAYASWSTGITAAVVNGSGTVTMSGPVVNASIQACCGNVPIPFWVTQTNTPILSVSTIGGATTTLTFSATPAWLVPAATFFVTGAGGAGCSALNNASFIVQSVTSTTVTIYLPISCSYIPSSGLLIGAPTLNSQGDSRNYYVVYQDSTHLNLTDVNGRPATYQGVNQPAAGWEVSNLLGFGTEPFFNGYVNRALYFAYFALASSDPVNSANASAYALGNAKWTATTGFNSQEKGLFYGRVFINCEPTQDTFCDTSPVQARELNGEGVNIATTAFLLNPTAAAINTLGQTMMSAMFSCSASDPNFDGICITADLAPNGGFLLGGFFPKWFGYYFGLGANWSWASAQLGGLTAPIPRVVQVSLNFQSASHAVLTVIRPDGTSSQVTCTSSPCPVTIDARQGDHLLSVKYLDAVNKVLLPAQQTIVKAR